VDATKAAITPEETKHFHLSSFIWSNVVWSVFLSVSFGVNAA